MIKLKKYAGSPRRSVYPYQVPAEVAIQEAIQKIEGLGADATLTRAVILLSEVNEIVSNFIDKEIEDNVK